MSGDSVRLYTIGYEGRNGAGFVRVLREAGIQRVVDVRMTAHSRNRDFSVYSLFERLRKAGIGYDHVKALGNPPEIRALWTSGDLARGRSEYRRHLANGASGGIDLLLAVLRVCPTAIMCREESADCCHRSVVAEAVQERDSTVEVIHL